MMSPGAAAGQTSAMQSPQSYSPANGVVAHGPATYGTVNVTLNSGTIVVLPQRVATVFAADPGIAEVRPASPTKLFIFGRGTGQTTVVATDSAGDTIAQYTVIVGVSDYPAQQTHQQAEKIAPGSNVREDLLPNGGVLSGTVDSAQQALMIEKQAVNAGAGGITDATLYNNMEVHQPIQVALKVRIASMSRTVTRTLGIDWTSLGSGGVQIGKFLIGAASGTGVATTLSGSSPGQVGVTFPGGTFEGVIDALAEDNLAHILAEPTLTTLSGTSASFHSGGEFPYATATSSGSSSNTSISVVFAKYGVNLTFTPVVLADNRIYLSVAPTFSTLDAANSVTIDGSTEPAIKDTEASSSIILGSGQGMAIAGMLLDQTSQTDNAVPGLGELPVLGALFRGDEYQRAQQEVVITVTPYLVNPVNDPGALASPDDGWTPANDLQRILLLRNNGSDPSTPPAAIPGDAGFMVQ
jgi:pilus assembly protein CpaC